MPFPLFDAAAIRHFSRRRLRRYAFRHFRLSILIFDAIIFAIIANISRDGLRCRHYFISADIMMHAAYAVACLADIFSLLAIRHCLPLIFHFAADAPLMPIFIIR
jgi:hypothetical protein